MYTYLRATLEIAYDISRVLACKTRRTYAHTQKGGHPAKKINVVGGVVPPHPGPNTLDDKIREIHNFPNVAFIAHIQIRPIYSLHRKVAITLSTFTIY